MAFGGSAEVTTILWWFSDSSLRELRDEWEHFAGALSFQKNQSDVTQD